MAAPVFAPQLAPWQYKHATRGWEDSFVRGWFRSRNPQVAGSSLPVFLVVDVSHLASPVK